MPSLSQATPKQWAAVRCSTTMTAYALMDELRAGPVYRDALRPHLLGALPDLLLAEWVAEDAEGMLSMADAGLRHLRG